MSQKLLINGQWLVGSGSELISTNPATQMIVWQGLSAAKSDVDRAFEAASEAFNAWALRPLEDRLAFLDEYKAQLQSAKDELADLISLETGKPRWETATEVAAMIGKIDLSIKAYHERTGTKIAGEASLQTALTHRPHGVCAVFGPYNFPGHLPNGHIVPALIAGNTIVYKPSDQTPGVGAKMVELLQASGLPAGVVNFVPGDIETAKAITSQSKLRGFFFTGSSQTGQIIHQHFASQPGKILALEMGGNNPLIVDNDVDIDAAVYQTIQSAFITAGQRCTCARRLLVPKGQFGDDYLKALIEKTGEIKIAEPDAEDQPFFSTVINNAAADNLLSAQQRLIELGAKPLLTMERIKPNLPYLSPSILDVTAIQNLPDEEYFGPLLQVIRYTSLDQAIEIANDTKYGLSAGMFTYNDEHWQRFYTLSHAGIVNRNKPLTGASGGAPFGGSGVSGNHRPGAYYAADYCAYPVASVLSDSLEKPEVMSPGLS